MTSYLFLLKETYIPVTHWTLFACNIFEVKDNVLDMNHLNFQCDGIPIEDIPKENFVILNEEELKLANMLYEPKE